MNNRLTVWTDEERDLILSELGKPHQDTEARNTSSPRQRGLLHCEVPYTARCYALFPVIWVQMLWGIRVSEACRLTVGDWDSGTRVLRVPAASTGSGMVRRFTVDQVTAQILDALTKGRGQMDLLFRCVGGRPWHPHLMASDFGCVLRRLRLPGSLYCVRRDAISSLLRAMRGDVAGVMAITGHPSLDLIDPSAGLLGTRYRTAAPVDDHATPPLTPSPDQEPPDEPTGGVMMEVP